MFANDKSIENLTELYKEVKKYIELQGEFIKLDIVEKLTILLSTLILIIVLLTLGMMALFYFSFMFIHTIEPYVGNLAGSYAILGGIIILVGVGIYLLRQRIIFHPMVNFLAKLFLEDKDNEHEKDINPKQ